jgi:hypothetical protein
MGAFGLASIIAPLVYAALIDNFEHGFELTFVAAAALYLLLAVVVPCLAGGLTLVHFSAQPEPFW